MSNIRTLMNRLTKLESASTNDSLVMVLRDVIAEDSELVSVIGLGGPWHRRPDETAGELLQRVVALCMQRPGVTVLEKIHEGSSAARIARCQARLDERLAIVGVQR